MTGRSNLSEKTETSSSPRLRPLGAIYWTRFCMAVAAGILCGLLRLRDVIGITLGLLFYIASFAIVRYILKIRQEVVGDRSMYSKGIGTFFATWITLWAIIHTFTPSQGP